MRLKWFLMDVLYVCGALLWDVIDDDNVAVLLHSVIHDFVLESIFVREYWNCTISGLLSKGYFHHWEHMDKCTWKETNIHPCSLKFWGNEIKVRITASSVGKKKNVFNYTNCCQTISSSMLLPQCRLDIKHIVHQEFSDEQICNYTVLIYISSLLINVPYRDEVFFPPLSFM